MRRHVLRAWSFFVAACAASFGFGLLRADPGGPSVAINFGADEPNGARSDVVDEAGVLGTVTWNNLDGAAGGPVEVVTDNDGVSENDGVMVTWASANTWSSQGRGEENNTAPDGPDRNLMTGYLDTTDTSVTTVDITGLDIIDAESFTVYLYVKGGVPGRGGTYTVNGITQDNVDAGAFDGTYIEGMDGNYLVFQGVPGPDISITATPTTTALFRAPLNAVEITPGEGPPLLVTERTVTPQTAPAECPPNGLGPVSVTISQPLGPDVDPSELVTVTEIVEPVAAAAVMADNGGTVGDAIASGSTEEGFITSWLLLGPFQQDGGGEPGEDAIRDDYLANANLSIEQVDVQPRPGDQVETDFGGMAASTGLAPTPGAPELNPGGIPTWFEISDRDDTIDFNEHYGGGIDNIMTYAVSYVTLPEQRDVVLCLATDDSTQILIDGDEVYIRNLGGGVGAANECVDAPVPVGFLDAGEHKIMVKVFQGGGGHGMRLALQDANTFEPIAFSVCTTPGADPCVLAPTGTQIDWEVTREQLAAGVGYTVDVFDQDLTFRGTSGGDPISGPSALTLGCDTRVTDLVCTGNAAGGLDMSWTNHPFADDAVEISIEVNGAEVTTVQGNRGEATLADTDLEDGWNKICVINSSGLPTCCRLRTSGIDPGDLLAGGDGSGTADPTVVGINADLGNLETAYNNADIPNTLEALQPVDQGVVPYVDSVFILPTADVFAEINSDLVPFEFAAGDGNDGTYNHILRDVTHDIDKGTSDVWAGGTDTWAAAVSIHAAAGITYDLEELRGRYGQLGEFRCFAGADQCGAASVNLYAIASDEADVLDFASVLGVLANGGESLVLPIPSDARYLTLACGAAGDGIGCDHCVFANALITVSDGSEPRFKRGDADAVGGINLTDGVFLLNFLFLGGPPPPCNDAADANDDGTLNITTGVFVFNWLFLGGPLPPAPGPTACGPDPTDDPLDCASYDNC